MKRVIITPADFGGAALNELKQWLAITTTHDDEVLLGLLKSSAEMCEAFTGSLPLFTACEEIHPISCDWQCLITRPVDAITQVEGIPAEGSSFVLAPHAFEIDLDADGTGRFHILKQGSAGRVAVRFDAGIAPDWAALPKALSHGIIRLAAQQFRERDNGQASSPPAAVTALWRPWRRMRLI